MKQTYPFGSVNLFCLNYFNWSHCGTSFHLRPQVLLFSSRSSYSLQICITQSFTLADDGRNIFQNVALLDLVIHDLINFLY